MDVSMSMLIVLIPILLHQKSMSYFSENFPQEMKFYPLAVKIGTCLDTKAACLIVRGEALFLICQNTCTTHYCNGLQASSNFL